VEKEMGEISSWRRNKTIVAEKSGGDFQKNGGYGSWGKFHPEDKMHVIQNGRTGNVRRKLRNTIQKE